MSRPYNFSAGPAMLPEPVLERAREEMLDWHGSGMCVAEMSHRGKEFLSIAEQAEADLRELLAVPDGYKVLFLQGGASLQFAMVPMNLLRGADPGAQGDYSTPAAGPRRPSPRPSASAPSTSPPHRAGRQLHARAGQDELACPTTRAYLHYTPNETIQGVEFGYVPETDGAAGGGHVLHHPVAPHRRVQVRRHLRRRTEEHRPGRTDHRHRPRGPDGPAIDGTPAMLDYKTHADADSMYNTPPTYAWYLAGLVFQWLKDLGGLKGMAAINQRKADKLYAAIDGSDFYANPVQPDSRSWMNVPFHAGRCEPGRGLPGRRQVRRPAHAEGHRSVGGMRASIYNAMPEAGVDALIGYMAEFERTKG
jgi:phosphoserine aminotransferase